nr:PREDICTED: C-type lectin domain family 12 member A-like [Rhinolophus sinicus]
MPEEVTYATLNFPNTSKAEKSQESCILKKTDNHEVPELELDGAAGNETGRNEDTAEVAGSRAVRGHTTPSKVWHLVAFIFLMLNLAVLVGLGTLILMNYQELFFSNRTSYDGQRSIIEQLERNMTLYMDIYKNVSSEHTTLKNMLENTLKVLNNFISKYSEDLKQKEKDLTLCSYSVSCACHGDSKKGHSSSMNMNNGKAANKTQLLIGCLPSPVSWRDVHCTLNKKNETAKNVSDFCILTCLAP